MAGSSFCRGLGRQKSDLALQNGDTQPPQVIFWDNVFVCFCAFESLRPYAQKLDRSKAPAQLHIMKWNPDLTCMIPHFLWHWNFGTEWHWCWCGDIHRSFLSDYIDFTKAGNVEQELPLQNGFLYTSGFSGETGSAPKKQGVGCPDFVEKTSRFVAGSSFCRGPSKPFFWTA